MAGCISNAYGLPLYLKGKQGGTNLNSSSRQTTMFLSKLAVVVAMTVAHVIFVAATPLASGATLDHIKRCPKVCSENSDCCDGHCAVFVCILCNRTPPTANLIYHPTGLFLTNLATIAVAFRLKVYCSCVFNPSLC